MQLEIAKRLKEARIRAGLSGKEAAAALGISASTLSGWENGIHEPTFAMAIKMAELYNVNLDWIIMGKEHIELDEESYSLIKSFNKLSDFDKGRIMGIIESNKNK